MGLHVRGKRGAGDEIGRGWCLDGRLQMSQSLDHVSNACSGTITNNPPKRWNTCSTTVTGGYDLAGLIPTQGRLRFPSWMLSQTEGKTVRQARDSCLGRITSISSRIVSVGS